ncbi:MAG: hypothetical protein RI911_819, partial [Candidatus Parcubacteria bacterium]
GPHGSSSSWVVVTHQPKLFFDQRFSDIDLSEVQEEGPLWTDDFNALTSVLSVPMPSFVTTMKSWFETAEEEETYEEESSE